MRKGLNSNSILFLFSDGFSGREMHLRWFDTFFECVSEMGPKRVFLMAKQVLDEVFHAEDSDFDPDASDSDDKSDSVAEEETSHVDLELSASTSSRGSSVSRQRPSRCRGGRGRGAAVVATSNNQEQPFEHFVHVLSS